MTYLEIIDPQGRRRHVKLDRPRFLIGREAACDICLPEGKVSRRHAQLQQTDQGAWILQDLNSLNRIRYQDQVVQQIVLEPGIQVRIGDFRLGLKGPSNQPEPQPVVSSQDSSTPSWPGLEPGWLEHLQMFQRSLLRLDQPGAVLDRLADEFKRIARPDLVAVGLNRPQGFTWEVIREQENTKPDEALISHMLRQVAANSLGDDSDVRTWVESTGSDTSHDTNITSPPPSSYGLLFRMKGRSGIIGHVYAQKPRPTPVPPAMQRYLSLYANYAGLLWENLQIIALRSAQKAMELELTQARQIQIELFPSSFDVDERVGAFAVNLPSVHVSGDYYDLIRTGPDTLGFVIADAMGHGMPAALMMASVRATLRMGLTLGLPWNTLFLGVDNIISQAKVTSFVTGIVGELNLSTRQLRLVIAGHHPPSLLLGEEVVEVPDSCITRPWGLDFEMDWQPGVISLGDKDWSILCYTDGVIDSVTRDGKPFGAKRVGGYHRQNAHLSAEDICQGILSAVASQSESVSLADDQTVLVLCSRNPEDSEESDPLRSTSRIS